MPRAANLCPRCGASVTPFAALVAFDRNRKGQRTMRNLAIVSGALALITFLFPFWPLGQLGPVSS